MVVGLTNTQVFPDHTTLAMHVDFAMATRQLQCWPRPQQISWTQVQATWPPPTLAYTAPADQPSTVRFRDLWTHLEASLQGQLTRDGPPSLSREEQGRGRRVAPLPTTHSAPAAKPSRQGEVRLRNDQVGSAVRNWFRQLRRLQSFLHALRGNHMDSNAQTHRACLWTSIQNAPGFHRGFPYWWDHGRKKDWHMAGFPWPRTMPGLETTEAIFLAFRHCFEKFESWHLRKRGAALKARYDRALKSLYQDLRLHPRESISYIFEDRQHTLQEQHGQLEPTPPPPEDGTLLWYADPEALHMHSTAQACMAHCSLGPGSVLYSRQYLTSPDLMHQALLTYWNDRWNQQATPTDSEWERILGFFRAKLPKLDFQCPPIIRSQWRRALAKYKPTAARGADGVSHQDLLNMPDPHLDALLQLPHEIENAQAEWPTQLLTGLVIALAKTTTAHKAADFRPVVVYSIIYRTWGAIRARQLARQLAPYLPMEELGFAPGCETTQAWMQIQMAVEQALLGNQDLSGSSTDLKRAFNCISRPLSQHLARQLGIPDHVVRPWMSFLALNQRRFLVNGFVSEPCLSSVGMPEGDALSVYAMLQLDFSYHLYLKSYAPGIVHLSYVDNLTLRAPSPDQVVHGMAVLESYFELWGLQVDHEKTYTWSLRPQSRHQFAALGFKTELTASEVGGVVTLSKRHLTAHLHTRLARSEPKLQLIQRSSAPGSQKQLALHTAVWPSSLHGLGAIRVPAHLLAQQRTKAVRALRVERAGASPMLRLTMGQAATCDPEYFLIRRTVFDFRRLLQKDPGDMTQAWQRFMKGYDGKARDGPFTVLAERLARIGWSARPPWLQDHDSHCNRWTVVSWMCCWKKDGSRQLPIRQQRGLQWLT